MSEGRMRCHFCGNEHGELYICPEQEEEKVVDKMEFPPLVEGDVLTKEERAAYLRSGKP